MSTGSDTWFLIVVEIIATAFLVLNDGNNLERTPGPT